MDDIAGRLRALVAPGVLRPTTLDMAADKIEELAEQVDDLQRENIHLQKYMNIHSCHDKCDCKWATARREMIALEERLEEMKIYESWVSRIYYAVIAHNNDEIKRVVSEIQLGFWKS